MVKRVAKNLGLILAAILILSVVNPFLAFRVNRYDPVDFYGYYEYSGVIGVHTSYSNGGLSYGEIGRLADSLNLHFVITTDLNSTSAMKDTLEKRYGMTLMIPGVEMSAEKGEGGFLVIGDSIPSLPGEGVEVDSALNRAVRNGSFVVATEPSEGGGRQYASRSGGGVVGGLVLYNLRRGLENLVSVTGINKLFGAFLDYTMDPNTLNYVFAIPDERMDFFRRRNMSTRTVGIATSTLLSNAFLGKSGKVRFPSYVSELEAVHTVIVTRKPYTAQYDHDRNLTINALKDGHAFVAFSGLEPARGFFFSATSGDTTVMMGDSLRLAGKGMLNVLIPDTSYAEIRILKDGKVVRKAENVFTDSLDISSPGQYSVEVFQKRVMLPLFLERRYPWIISNPIYVYKSR